MSHDLHHVTQAVAWPVCQLLSHDANHVTLPGNSVHWRRPRETVNIYGRKQKRFLRGNFFLFNMNQETGSLHLNTFILFSVISSYVTDEMALFVFQNLVPTGLLRYYVLPWQRRQSIRFANVSPWCGWPTAEKKWRNFSGNMWDWASATFSIISPIRHTPQSSLYWWVTHFVWLRWTMVALLWSSFIRIVRLPDI